MAEETIETTETKTYNINDLADKPYSEMTDDEIEFVIEYRATEKANHETAMAEVQAVQDHLDEVAEIHKQAANENLATLNKLVANALAADEASKKVNE